MMNSVEEQILELKAKNEELLARNIVLEKNAKDYIAELSRVATGTADLYKILQDNLNSADILRNRLRKVLTAFERSSALLAAVEAKSDTVEDLRVAYNKALLDLETPDNIPGTMQASTEKP